MIRSTPRWLCLALLFAAFACEPRDAADSLWKAEEETPAPPAAPAPAPPAPVTVQLPAPVVHPPVKLDAPESFADLVESLRPSVVNIYTTNLGSTLAGRQQYNPFDGFDQYGIPSDQNALSLGTGFIISIDGHILTNNHVIDGASRIKVRLFDEREATAELIGTDPNTDIALIKIATMPNLQPLPLGDSMQLRVGDWVLAIGNPLGLAHTVTTGIVSARGRTDVPLHGKITYMDFIQTDASINPGNSGGPLINLRGEAVGINTAISRQGQGIGFAIPINMARDILPQLMTTGRVVRAFIGIFPKPVPPQLAETLGLPPNAGALVDRVLPGGPAHQAGIQADDVVVSFDGHPINAAKDLRWLAETSGVGRAVNVEILRDGNKLSVTLITEQEPD